MGGWEDRDLILAVSEAERHSSAQVVGGRTRGVMEWTGARIGGRRPLGERI